MSNLAKKLALTSAFRPAGDEYRTPPMCLEALASKWYLPTSVGVYDPSCGSELWTIGSELVNLWDGSDSNTREVYLDDIRPNPYWCITGTDFLKVKECPLASEEVAIVTNPPYDKLAEQFLLHAWSLKSIRYVCFLISNSWLFAKGRERPLCRQMHLAKVINMIGRVQFELSISDGRKRLAFNLLNAGVFTTTHRVVKMTWEEAFSTIPNFPKDDIGKKKYDPVKVMYRPERKVFVPGTPAGGYSWAIFDKEHHGFDFEGSNVLLNNPDDWEDEE